MQDLIKYTAVEIKELLKKREISPLELLDITEKHIIETDPHINAMPVLCFERARKAAKKIMQDSKTEKSSHYLYGVPIAIKDLDNVSGVKTTKGFTPFRNNVAAKSDYYVELLEKNGAIIVGKSNVPEFGAGSNTFNGLFGVTSNPWDTKKTAGGSSGGAAAALASGQVWLASGTDLGGSIRIPASFCSVVGLRPSPGLIPVGPDITPFSYLKVAGPMARNVADTALMLDAMAGYNMGDPRSARYLPGSFGAAIGKETDIKKVAYSCNMGLSEISSEVEAVFNSSIKSLVENNIRLEESFPDLQKAEHSFQTLRAMLLGTRLRNVYKEYKSELKEDLVWNIEKGLNLKTEEIMDAEVERNELYRNMIECFNEYDFVICPTVITPPFDSDLHYLEEIEGHELKTYIDWLILTYAITLTSCPSISIPCGFTSNKLPVGIQIIGKPKHDLELLSFAACCEKVFNVSGMVPVNINSNN